MLKRFFSHPMSWFVVIYVLGFIIASIVISPIALIHPALTVLIVGTFLFRCWDDEQTDKLRKAINKYDKSNKTCS